MSDPLNDPMVVAVEQGNGKLPHLNSTQKVNPIEEFFQELHQSMKSVDLGTASQTTEQITLDIPPYTADYKPEVSSKKRHLYSINELLAFSRELPAATSEEVINSLPKKKFWRLNRRFSDHQAHGKNVGHKNAKNIGSNRPVSNDDMPFERRNNKNKGARATHPKRGSRFSKNEDLMEEKDIAVNNDDLLALEEEFEPTGNSMADFEMWKAKMREMERKKKGLPANDTNELQEPIPAVSTTSSSISDFLKLSNKITEPDAARSQSIPDLKASTDKESMQKHDTPTEPVVGTSSRFSSFFTNSTSSVSSPYLKPAEPELASNSTHKNPEVTSSKTSGSRLMSFFNKEQNVGGEAPVFVNSPKEQPKFMPPPGFPPQNKAKEQQEMPPTMPPMQQIPQQIPQQIQQQQPLTNNAFFQGLLNKGKVGGSTLPAGPPPGVAMPSNGPHISQQGQRHRQTAQQAGVGVPPGFNMGMHPPGFVSPMQGGPVQVPNGMPMANSTKNSNNGNQSNKPQQPLQQRQPPLQPGMLPQQFVPPPGFPSMQSIPPNFNPNMYIPSNGMMPPNGQQFFPPVPPPNGVMNFPPFPNQAGFPPRENRNK